jgi:hypothetical protein
MIESGTVQAVYDETLGSVLVTDVVAADETVYVASVAHFSPGGGTLSISDGANTEDALTYTGVDEASQALLGVATIVNSYDADDTRVNVYPTATVRIVEVRLDGQQDTVRARLPYSMFDKLTAGFVADTEDESLRVLVEMAAGEYVVNDVLGTVPTAILNTVEVLDDLTVEGVLTLVDGASANIEAGVHVHLNGQQAEPSLAPTVTQDWDTESQWDLVATSTSPEYRRRSWYHVAADNDVYYVSNSPSSGNFGVRKYDLDTGTSSEVLSHQTDYFYGSLARIGTDWYALVWHAPSGDWKVRKYNSSWVFQSTWDYARPSVYSTIPVIADDGTDLWFLDRNDSTGLLRFRRINTAGTVQETLTGDSYWSASGNAISYHVGNFDYGAESHVFTWDNDPDTASVADSTGARVSAREFPTPLVAGEDANGAGMAWDGTNFWAYGSGGTSGSNSFVKRFKLTENMWASESNKWWVSHTWYNLTNGYETLIGPKKLLTMKKRKRLLVDAGALLPTGGAAPPEKIQVYIGRGATEPTDANMFLQGESAVGETSMYLEGTAFSGTFAPTTNTFPGSDPAVIEPATEDGWSLKGDETTEGFTDIQTFTADGTWTKPKIGGLSTVEVFMIGGGGGGGGGRRNSGGNAACGGGGGAGASFLHFVLPISLFAATETVTVGQGGSGGAGRTTNIDGGAGSDGTQSKMTVNGVADVIVCGGGDGGSGGSTSATANGGQASNTTENSMGGFGGTPGADGATNAGGSTADRSPQVITVYDRRGASGGGGGGGVNAAGTVGAGGNGGACYDLGQAVGGATSISPDNGNSKGLVAAFAGSGGGGAGGRASGGAAKAGGNGGLYGGGGGGGGGGQTQDSGAGGDGADGIVVVICR